MATSFPPLEVRARYRPDGAIRRALVDEVAGAADAAAKAATASLGQIGDQVGALLKNAAASAANPLGAIDLGAGRFREAAAGSQRLASQARELASALTVVAREQGQLDAATQRTVNGLLEEAAAHDRAAADALGHARAADTLQATLNRQASATAAVVGASRQAAAANDNLAVSAGQQRIGLQQLGFQLGDIATQFALGARPAQIFAAQASQVSQALTLMGGTGALGAVGRFLAGPWGVALTIGTVALTPLISKLFETKDAAEEVKFTSFALSDAQSVLGGVIDLTTGKIQNQSSALIALARAQALAGQIKARSDIAEARGELGGLAALRPRITAGFGGGLNITRGRNASGDIASALLDGSINPAEAVAGLESLRKAGFETEKGFLAAAASVTKLGVAAENLKAFESVERLVLGRGTVADRALLLKPSKGRTPRKSRGDGGAAAREEFGEDAATRVANIADQFSRISPAVREANRATRQLDDLIDDLARKQPINFEKTIADAKAAKQVVADSLAQPYRDLLAQQDNEIRVQRLRVQGREAEADALAFNLDLANRLGVEDEQGVAAALQKVGIAKEEYAALLRNLGVQRELTREGQRASAAQQRQLGFIADTRANLVNAVAGLRKGGIGALGDLVNSTLEQFNRAAAENLVDKIFGNAFIDAEDAVTKAHRVLAETGLNTAKALNSLAESAVGAAGAQAGDPAIPEEITDQIVVLAKKVEDFSDPRNLLGLITKNLAKAVGISDEEAAKIGKAVGANVEGALFGQIGSSLILGGKGSALGAGVGGVFGEAAFKKLAPELFKKLGDFAGPLGSIAGGVIGGLVGGLLKKTKTGTATLSVGADGVQVGSTGGNSSSRRQAASTAGDSVSDALNRIAEQLGGSADGPISVSIGIRDKNYRVDPTGRGNTKTKKGAIDFGQDQAAAQKFAIADAIKDGVLTGISAGSQRLLKAGSDVDRQLQKALDFEGTLARIKSLRDPVAAVLDTLDKEFGRLSKIFTEAGASAAELAGLEELYAKERGQAVKEALESVGGSLKSLLDDLTVGNDARSLREREAAARARYDPLRARAAAGDVTSFDDFSEAARALLDIERQINGSQAGYFALLDEVTSISKGQLDAINAKADAAANRDSPFTRSAATADDSAGVISAIDRLGSNLLDGLGIKLDALIFNQIAQLKQGASAPATSASMARSLRLPEAVGYW